MFIVYLLPVYLLRMTKSLKVYIDEILSNNISKFTDIISFIKSYLWKYTELSKDVQCWKIKIVVPGTRWAILVW